MLNQIFSAEYDYQVYHPEFYLYEPYVVTIRSRMHQLKQVQIYNMENIKEDIVDPRTAEIVGGLCYGCHEYDKRYRPKLIQDRFFSKNHFLPVVFPTDRADRVRIEVWHISPEGIKEQWNQIVNLDEVEDEGTKFEIFSRMAFLDSYNWAGIDCNPDLYRTLIYHIRLDMRRVDSYRFGHGWTDIQAFGYYKDTMYCYIGKDDADDLPVAERHSFLVRIKEGVPEMLCWVDNCKDSSDHPDEGIHMEFWHDGYVQLCYKWDTGPTCGRLLTIPDIEKAVERTTETHTANGMTTEQTAKIIKLGHLYDEGTMDLDFLTESFRYGNMDKHHRVNFFL